jgi:hypothetical protein
MVPEMGNEFLLPASFRAHRVEPDKLCCHRAWRLLCAVGAHDFKSLKTCETSNFTSRASLETTKICTISLTSEDYICGNCPKETFLVIFIL